MCVPCLLCNNIYSELIPRILISQPEADKVNFHFIAFVNANGQLHEFGKHFNSLCTLFYVFFFFFYVFDPKIYDLVFKMEE